MVMAVPVKVITPVVAAPVFVYVPAVKVYDVPERVNPNEFRSKSPAVWVNLPVTVNPLVTSWIPKPGEFTVRFGISTVVVNV